jgi:hypothetical protein
MLINFSIKYHALKAVIIIVVATFTCWSNCFCQTRKTAIATKVTKNKPIKKQGSGVTQKNDSISIIIKNRAIDDLIHLVETSDPSTPENKLMKEKSIEWPEEKQERFLEFFKNSINDYVSKVKLVELDAAMFLYFLSEFKGMDKKRISEQYDIRVSKTGNNHIAEFWEDGLDLNSEKHAIKNALNAEQVEVIKHRYGIVRGTIKSGKNKRYVKMMALLYNKQPDGTVIFIEPLKAMMDFK